MTASETPLTCEYCDNSPATQVIIVDHRRIGRNTSLVCAPCGAEAEPEARKVFGLVWRYTLTPLEVAA